MYRLLPAVVAIVVVSILPGCGGSGSHVSGKVSFKGKPVPAGKIYFIPDGSKDNEGPTGYATITDGYYDTSASDGKAAATGPMIVAIEGWDPSTPGKSENPDEKTFKSLFPRWETELNLEASGTHNFEVPAEAAKPDRPGDV